MIISKPFLPAPGRLFLPGCAIAAGMLAVSPPTFAAPAAPQPVAAPFESISQVQSLRIGKTATFKLVKPWDYRVTKGFANVLSTHENETLTVKALAGGPVKIRLFAPDGRTEWINLNLIEPRPVTTIRTERDLQIVQRAPLGGVAQGGVAQGGVAQGGVAQGGGTSNPIFGSSTSEQGPNANLGPATVGGVNPGAPFGNPVFGTSPLAATASGTTNLPAPTLPALGAPYGVPVAGTGMGTAPGTAQAGMVGAGATPNLAPQISPSLPPPLASASANVGYQTLAQLPQSAGAGGSKQGIDVVQGMAKLIQFRSNVLAVFFSNPNSMDARAINARTIAVTGVGGGTSTLAVFTSRFAGDAVGRANIYRIQTVSGAPTAIPARDPRVLERAITLALGDPRVSAKVIKLSDGSLATRLAGTVRNEAEVQAAIATATFYVPRERVISSLYADINAPTLDAVIASGSLSISPESGLQDNLRRVTGNRSIELVSLPTGLAFKAEVNSADEAQSLLRLLPSLNQQVIPFIVIRGQDPSAAPYYNSTVPVLNNEDRQLTQKLHDVTGVNSVYAVRVSANSLACYGTVRTRTEYNTVRRYMLAMAQSSVAAVAPQGSPQGVLSNGTTLRPQGNEGASLPSYDISGGYSRALGLQMFVRITDPGQSVIRKVTVETSIVEITHTALKNLGVEYGTVSVLSESVTGGTVVSNGGVNGTPGTPGTPGTVTSSPIITTRTIDPTFTPGSALAGNGFAGGGSFANINPFRARINALVTNGDARVLSRPNISAIEGAAAQITIGGERPVPKAVATQGAVGSQIEFRRFGVIISMRPTVTGDNTILLQIRADVTAPDRTYEINVGGALIPGESVRSVDTVINVRPGDTVVMGGLITNEKRQQMSRVPVLGSLPIIGPLFRSKRFDNNETELAIFMSPRIESMPADPESIEEANRIPSLPLLPSREESSGILFQPTGGG